MGYDLHISRAEEYYDSDAHPIPLDEWLSYAEGTPRFGRWDGSAGTRSASPSTSTPAQTEALSR